MEGELIPGLAGGDIPPGIKREHESIDDFEHLERDSRPMDARAAIDDFLQAERGPTPQELVKPQDLLTEKFTDSESETGSPLHHPQRPVQQPPPPPLEEPLLPDLAFNKPLPSSKLEQEKDSEIKSVPEKNVPENPALVTPHSVLDFIKETISPPQSELSSLLQKEPLKPAPTEPPKPAHVEPVKVVAKEPAPVEKPKPVQPAKTTAHIIEAEVIFCQMGLDAWFDPQRLHPKVESLIYWREPVWSGAALGAGLALMVALASCSVVSVLAYCSLLVLLATAGFRIYKSVMQAVHKTNDGHPFKALLESEIAVSSERAQQVAAAATAHLNAATHELRRLFLVEDLVDSLKFGVLLWCLTYVGACFNGITLIILGWIGLFTLPKAYEANKAQVDANLELARAKINEITSKVRAAVPLGKKPESEKDK